MTQTQTPGIKAIETVYNGYRFRSRLEARWAVFFDALGVRYEYEKEGFDLGEAGWYLPDFWLETVNMWAEVKPYAFTEEEYGKCALLARGTGHAVLMLDGAPDHERLYDYVAWDPGRTLVDEIYPGVIIEEAVQGDWMQVPVTLDDSYIHSEHRWWSSEGHRPSEYDASDITKAAYLAARQARFEHGETPQTRTQKVVKASISLEDEIPGYFASEERRLAHEREMQRRSAEAIEMLRDYVANFDERWDAHAKETAERWPGHARKYCTPENKARDRRAAEYRIRKYDLNMRMAAHSDRLRVLEAQGDQDALRAALMERQALAVEMRDLHTEFCSLFSPKTKSRRTPTVNKL